MAPTVSVIINSVDRADSLRATLRALRHQRHDAFEVIVVEGPSDHPYRLEGEGVRHLHCEVRNLPASRNIGIAAAAGELVAFIDDDAIPEPRWLSRLAAEFSDPRVGGAGGITYDHTGTRLQYGYARCDRLGQTAYGMTPVSDAEQSPGADTLPYLQGTNMCLRRETLRAVGGFDEGIGYVYDDVDICRQTIDSGAVVRCVGGAAVYHKYLPSRVRNSARVLSDPHLPTKDRAYFASVNGSSIHGTEAVVSSLLRYVADQRATAVRLHTEGRYSDGELEFFLRRLDEGLRDGLLAGLGSQRTGREIAAADRSAFAAYRRLLPEQGRRLTVCLLAGASPPPAEGVRAELARVAVMAAGHGHEVHVIAREGNDVDTLDFEDDCWVHRVPAFDKRVPELASSGVAPHVYRLIAGWHDVLEVDSRQAVDLVLAPTPDGEGLACALDPGLWTVAVPATTAADGLLAQETDAHSRRTVGDNIGPELLAALAERAADDESRRPERDARAAAVAAALGPILERAADLTPDAAASATRRLLDPGNHPLDVRAEIAAAWAAPPRVFVSAIWRSLLRREPSAGDLEGWEPQIEPRGWRRDATVKLASSDEAQGLGVDSEWLAVLRQGHWPVDHRALARDLRAVWDVDDEQFLDAAAELILGRAPNRPERASAGERRADGASRHDIVSWLASLPDARVRDVRARALLGELGESPDGLLRRAWSFSDEGFVRRVHEIVLEREVEPDLLGQWAADLAHGGARLAHLRLVASSDEARTVAMLERSIAPEPTPEEPVGGLEPWMSTIEADPPPEPRPKRGGRVAARLRRDA